MQGQKLGFFGWLIRKAALHGAVFFVLRVIEAVGPLNRGGFIIYMSIVIFSVGSGLYI